MANFNPVKPGDLITADYFNQVLGSFDVRISKLEAANAGGGQIVIQQLLPLGNFYVQDQMHVVGQNFGVPANVVVTVAGQRVTTFAPGSGNTDLYFTIPPVQGLSQQGSVVPLVITNPTSTASTTFTLLPLQITTPTGNLSVALTGSPAVGSIKAGNSYQFVFTVTGYTSLTDNFAITVGLDTASAGAGWTAVAIDPITQKTITQIQIPQGQGTTTPVTVNMTIPAVAGVGSAQLSLSLTSNLNPTGLGGSGNTTITVNAPPPPPNQIALAIVQATVGTVSADGSSVSLPSGTTTTDIIFQATVPDVASYTVGPLTFADTSWKATLKSNPDPKVGQPGATPQIRYTVTPPSSTNTTTMTLTVTEDGKPSVFGKTAFQIKVG